MVMPTLKPVFVFALATLFSLPHLGFGQDTADSEDQSNDSAALLQDGGVVDYWRDVQPIFASKCLECHGPDDAKNDFRIDEMDAVLDYLEPGDLESSSLWADYMLTDDPDMRMPPTDHTQLTAAELATVRLWIEEGAEWPAAPEGEELEEVEPVADVSAKPLAERVWMFQGIFHPASVHLPIALLSVSAFFVFLSFFKPDSFEAAAYHCLWIGALGAIAACVMGWSYAQHEGYGASYSFDLNNSAIDRHRWLGIAVAVLAVILVPMARAVRKRDDTGMRVLWMIGSLLMLGAVSTTGYQGGELTYGEGHYEKEFQRLFPEAVNATDPVDAADANAAGANAEHADSESTEPEEAPSEVTDLEGEANTASDEVAASQDDTEADAVEEADDPQT